MKPTRLVLIGMLVLIGLVGVTALAGPPIMRMLGSGGGDGRITIAIATESMLDGFREAAEAQVANAARAAPEEAEEGGAAVEQATTSSSGSANPPSNNSNAARDDETRQHANAAGWVAVLQSSLRDALGNELAQRLIESRRFEVRDSSQFMTALEELNRREETGGSRQSIFSLFQRNSTKQTSSPPGGQIERREGEATLQTIASSFNNNDLRGAGRALGADYVLVVALSQGSFRHVHTTEPYSTTINHDNRWEPIVIFRVFNVSTGNVVMAKQVALSPAIVVRDEGQGAEQMASEFQLQLNDRVADMVTSEVLAVLAPARIASTEDDTITINRGSRDGVREGQVYDVEREAVGGVRDVNYDAETGRVSEGATLEPHRERVGQLRILTVQDNIATAAPVEGTLARGDIVVVTPSTTRALMVSNTGRAGAEVPLGEGQAAQVGARASLAVGDIRVELLEPPDWRRPSDPRMLLSRGIAGHLVESGMVNILTRSDLDRLRQERELMARSQGIDNANVDLGMDTAGNLLTGEIQISASQAGPTVSVGGQSRQTRTAWRLTASGTLRVQTVGGTTIYSVAVRTERPGSPQDATAVNNLIDAASADAAAALLVRMFPIRVVSVSGANVVLNRGPEAGLRTGARLAAYRIDPSTRTRQRLGELVVTDAAAGYNASARFAAQPFNTDGNVEVEILSGGAAPQARPAPARGNSTGNTSQDQQPASVNW
ncbi:MAG: hypothetical protein KF779_11760 [Hyphomonadaceae bacterium]|nr:hypothetical protein [Hyphomonadaceae bacterium]